MATIVPLIDLRAASKLDALVRDAARAPVPATRPADRRARPPLHDLRISVTDRCNFRCVYCMPKDVFGARLPVPAARRPADVRGDRARRAGLRRARRARRSGSPAASRCCAGTSSGWSRCSRGDRRRSTSRSPPTARCSRRRRAALRDAGLKRVTVSLDSLDDATFRAMNDVDFPVARVLEGIDAAAAAGPRAGQDQHGGEARRQRGIDRADGAAFPRHRPHRPLHRVHGRRRDQRLAHGRRRARRRDRAARSTPSCRSRASTPTTTARWPSAGATATAAARSASSRR